MTPEDAKHRECTVFRAQAHGELFGDKPAALPSHHTLAWEWPAVDGSPWKNAFFLLPLPSPHREFAFEIDGDPVSFLWHIPISDQERAFKQELGADALLDRMGEARLPWIFEEANRPSLVD
jgi:hypothetical protein